MTHRYSLTDYTVTIKMPDAEHAGAEGSGVSSLADKTISIGGVNETGEGTFLGQIAVQRQTDTWETQADPTGSWVHSKSLDRHGQVTLSIYQVSDDIVKFYLITKAYENDDYNTSGMTITIDRNGSTVCTCTDCYITKAPEWRFDERANTQEWIFTCGKIDFNVTTAW